MNAHVAKFEAILLDVAAGVATYKALDAHKLCRKTFYGLLASDTDAAARYSRAKSDGLERLADEILELADKSTPKTAERVRVQVDVRKWLLSKLANKRYGDRLELQGELAHKVVRVKDLTGDKGDGTAKT